MTADKTAAPDLGTPITMTYRNYRGEVDQRSVVPSRIWFGSTDWHPEPGWLMSAYDLGKAAHRDFALADCQFADLCASGQQVRALEWRQGTRKDDRTAHSQCGVFAVGSDDAGGWFAVHRFIDPEGQTNDANIGWADNRELAMDDCEHEHRAHILAALTPAPQAEGQFAENAKKSEVAHQQDAHITPATPTAQEPAAWLIEGYGATDNEKFAKVYGEQQNKGVTPLYTHPPQPSVSVAEVERAFEEIRELNMSGRDENGHRWANSDLIDQTVTTGLIALRALRALKGVDHG